MASIYQEDLAYIHHVGFGDLALGAAPGLLDALRESGLSGGLVVDLGCGGGLWLRELLRAGYAALGVDASPHLIKLAEGTAPGARLRLGSVYEFDPPPCAAVTALGEVLNYMPPDGPRPPGAELFRRVHGALEPGGLLLFDVIVRAEGDRMAYRAWRAGEDWAVLTDVNEDAARGLLTRDIIAFRKVGGAYRRSEERHAQAVYRQEEIEKALRAAGFFVESGDRYGGHAVAPRRRVFQARKRG